MHLLPFTLGACYAIAGAAAAATCQAEAYWDYVVVGGGPSGIITAEKLSAANKKVLLLERGHGPTVGTGSNYSLSWNESLTPIDVPGLSGDIGSYDLWNDYICPDTPANSACVLGGGVTVNYMVFIHPPAHDFENWPQGWNWEDIAPAAERLYSRNPGTTLPSEDGKYYDQGLYTTLSTFLGNLGWKSVDLIKDVEEKHEVYSHPSWNIKDTMRAGPVRTYLPLAQERDNFALRLNSKATRLIRSGSHVTGVEYESAGKRHVAHLARNGRVVLSSGAMSTPRILFNSGIGPAAQIQKAKKAGAQVPPEKEWINLPVGQGIRDHPIFPINVKTNGTWSPLDSASVLNGSDVKNIELYESKNSGVLTQGKHGLLFYTSKVGSDGNTRYFQGSCAPTGKGTFSITAYMTHGATSKGDLGIDEAGNAVFEKAPFMHDEADKEASRDFVQSMLDAISAPGTGLTLDPATSNATEIISKPSNGNHYIGTAKMGTDDGRYGGSSVVDTNTKVYGVDNLFVADASIHPDLPTGNTQAIVMVVAEAAAAKILAYQG